MSFAKRTLNSAAWSFSTGYANILIGFFGNLILARILLPEDFGVFALASSLLVFVTMFTGFGSQEAIMQCRDESIVDLIPTAFWISLAIGWGVAVVGILIGLIFWPYYGHTIALLIVSLSLLVPFNSLASARDSLLRRDMVYKSVALTQTIANTASFILGIIVALMGVGPWALLIRQGSAVIIYWLGMEISSNYRLQRVYNKEAARSIWNFGWRKMFMQINDVFLGRYDNLMVGTFIGQAQLGYYSQAYRLAWLGQQFTQGAIAPILLPMFATVQYSVDKLRYSFERVTYWICRVIPLMGVLIFLSGKSAVIFLYGQKWAVAGQYFQMMFVFFMFLPLAVMLKYFLTGAGYIDKALKAGWVQLFFFVVGVTTGAVLKNMTLVIWAVNLNYILAVLLMGYAAGRIIPINWGYLCAVPALVFALTLLLGQQVTTWLPETFLGMLLLIFILTLVYVSLMTLFEYRSLRQEIDIILKTSQSN